MIYIVTAGEYEDNHNTLVTIDLDEAINLMLKLPADDCVDGFGDIEAWEDGEMVACYTSCDLHFAKRDNKDIKEDVENHFKRGD